MIKVIEKDLLNDNFINKNLTSNINKDERIYFSKNNIYYFGNYTNNLVDSELMFAFRPVHPQNVQKHSSTFV